MSRVRTAAHAVRAHLVQAHAWAHRGPVRSLVAKVVMTMVGVVVAVSGVAMLVLPGPGLVVIGIGLGLLASEWAWARRALHAVTTWLSAAKQTLLPSDATPGRRAAGAVFIGAMAVVGFLATTATTALIGTVTLF